MTRIARCQAEEVDAAVQAARKAFAGQLGEWARWSARQRGEWLLRFADVIESQHEQLAALECADTGKPMTQAKGDIAACARYFRFYGGAADKLHGETIPFETDFAVMSAARALRCLRPDHPLELPVPDLWALCRSSAGGGQHGGAQTCRRCLPERHAPSGARGEPWAARRRPERGAGVGRGSGCCAGFAPWIDHLSFTGSPETGTRVAQFAAQHHVPITLELGGKSPQLVFADADLEAALPAVVRGIVQNAGQTCSAGSRLLVQREIADTVVTALAQRFAELRCDAGKPMPTAAR